MDSLCMTPQNTAFILIEYQNEWVSENGTLRSRLIKDKAQFVNAISISKEMLMLARKYNYHVIHVLFTPDENYRIFGHALWGIRQVVPTAGTWRGFQREIHEDFLPLSGEHVITERSGVSAFSGSNLDSYLRNNHITNLILTGFATHVCVESTLRDAHDSGYNTMVLTEATGAFTDEQKKYFSENIVHHFGKEIDFQELKTQLSRQRV